MSDLTSRPYHPDPAKCCERCAFGRGEHAEWCPEFRVLSAGEQFWGSEYYET